LAPLFEQKKIFKTQHINYLLLLLNLDQPFSKVESLDQPFSKVESLDQPFSKVESLAQPFPKVDF
jgi:uncharacterized protein (DUF1778 family)